MNENEPDAEGERGAAVMTASIAAYDGQIGQVAYSASKGGIAAMTLPAARDLSRPRQCACARSPPACSTPRCSPRCPRSSARPSGPPSPSRRGSALPAEYAQLAIQIAENTMLNGETIRLDGALRMAPR